MSRHEDMSHDPIKDQSLETASASSFTLAQSQRTAQPLSARLPPPPNSLGATSSPNVTANSSTAATITITKPPDRASHSPLFESSVSVLRSSFSGTRPPRRLPDQDEPHRVRFSEDVLRESYSQTTSDRHGPRLTPLVVPTSRPSSLTVTPTGTVAPRISIEERKGVSANASGLSESPGAGAEPGRWSTPFAHGFKDPRSLENYWAWLVQKQKRRKKHRHRIQSFIHDWYKKVFLEGILRQYPISPSKDGRHIPVSVARRKHLVDERTGKPFISNFIRSTRYTVWNFLPKQIIFQFSKLANFYFLVIGIMQMIPGLSTTGSYTTIAPLVAFVGLSMLKEAWDDYRRYRLDKVENRSDVWVLDPRANARGTMQGFGLFDLPRKLWYRVGRSKNAPTVVERTDTYPLEGGATIHRTDASGTWCKIPWQNIRVGDIVRLRRDENVPADMILLHATGPNGIAYIDTMALDGETNLKSKQTCPLLAEHCDTLSGLRNCRAEVVAEDPNLDLYNFDGKVLLGEKKMPLTINQVIFRGSIMRNTAEAFGLVVNTGEECKIRMNTHKNVRAKAPVLQLIVNRIIVVLVLFVVVLAVGCTVGYQLWAHRFEKRAWYLKAARVPFKEIFLGFIIQFNTLIPLSLYVSLEIVKLGQLFLLRDVEMYHKETDTPMVANTSTILENLGQVGYVFSDKTGTLTENLMRFRKLSIAGTAWLHDLDVRRASEDQPVHHKSLTKPATYNDKLNVIPDGRHSMSSTTVREALSLGMGTQPRKSTASHSRWKPSVRPDHAQLPPNTDDLVRYIWARPNTPFSRKARHFILCLALCHTCLPETKGDGAIEYQAASPDELALVEAAKDLGYMLVERSAQTIVLRIPKSGGHGQTVTESYQVLDVIEFSSKRKRMSISIRMPDGRVCLFTKGADSVILPRLRLNHLAKEKATTVEMRANKRKSIEQEMALRRKSMQPATPRGSLALGRPSTTIKRHSMGKSTSWKSRSGGVTDEVDLWLRQRETADFGGPCDKADEEAFSTPRQSINRPRSCDIMRSEDEAELDALVDEALAVNDGAIFERCFQHVDDFASEGLRTLLFAYRYLDDAEYETWKKVFVDATTSLVDRQERIEAAAELIEQKFDLAGATAIEDKLQDGVPDTIDKLRRANIKVWMLTGDKRETAVNIAYSARICKPFSELYVLDSTMGNLQDGITTTLLEVGRGMVAHSVVVVDGHTLSIIEADESLKILFFDLVTRVDSVICSRASPAQKATLVKCIRHRVPSAVTLAIGDGANDIAMIQASHVGIGISGREGLQAARISDYSIAQFRFLQKLLLVHGRWNYIRTGRYILATFWKEVVFYLVQALFQRYNGYTGTSLYEPTSLTVFNTLFTSLPVILPGMFEQDLNADTLLAVPELYAYGQKNMGFNFWKYIAWMAMASSEALIIWYIIYHVFRRILFTEDSTLYAMGDLAFTACVILINVKLLVIEMHTQTIITLAGLLLSVGGWFLWNIMLAFIFKRSFGPYLVRHSFIHNFGHTLKWWVTLAIVLLVLFVYEIAIQAVWRTLFPTDQHVMQIVERYDGVMKVMHDHAVDGDKRQVEPVIASDRDDSDAVVQSRRVES